MSVDGARPLPPEVARGGQGRAEAGVDLNLTGRDLRQGHGQGADPRQREGFGRALQKALAKAEEADPVQNAAAPGPVAVPLVMVDVPLPEMPVATTGGARAVAERIDRYLRGAEGAASLLTGEGMVVKLPANALGVSQVSVRMVGAVMEVTLSMQAAAATEAGMRAQLAALGRDLAQRQGRHGVRLLLEGEVLAEEGPQRFDPLMPRGRT